MESPREVSPDDAEKIVHPVEEASERRRALKIVAIVIVDLFLLAITAGLIWAMWLPGIIRSRH